MTEKPKHQSQILRLLCLSNGHGEDIIAVRILQSLQQYLRSESDAGNNFTPNIVALPLVGEGRAYTQHGIPIIGSVKTMPSGGFVYMDGRELIRDLQGGLLQLTLAQIKAVKNWIRQADEAMGNFPNTSPPSPPILLVLAVGDIVPLLFAWLSGANYAFVGTAKSEYYVQDENGTLPRSSLFARLENWSGSVYLPWERWLMSHSRCKAVFPRDTLTAQILQKWSIPAFDLGNPMMDQLEPVKPLNSFDSELEQTLTVLLLPGSRPPEAYSNWSQIITAAENLSDFSDRPLLFLGAIAPNLSLDPFCQILESQNWHRSALDFDSIQNWQALTFTQKNASIILTQHAYNECLHLGQLAIAMAGTATEQFVGLGKPAITFPGKGPQFTYAFAQAQSRHLGASIILLEHPNQIASAVQSLLNNPHRLIQIAENGLRRMGKPGAARRIAQCLIEKWGVSFPN